MSIHDENIDNDVVEIWIGLKDLMEMIQGDPEVRAVPLYFRMW
jgi:hypothetical protein